MKAGRGHVCKKDSSVVGTIKNPLQHSPCRYRQPFDAPRGLTDSLVLTITLLTHSFLFISRRLIPNMMLTHILFCFRLLSVEHPHSWLLKLSPSNHRQRRPGARRLLSSSHHCRLSFTVPGFEVFFVCSILHHHDMCMLLVFVEKRKHFSHANLFRVDLESINSESL
jgi:hypothetical protein